MLGAVSSWLCGGAGCCELAAPVVETACGAGCGPGGDRVPVLGAVSWLCVRVVFGCDAACVYWNASWQDHTFALGLWFCLK